MSVPWFETAGRRPKIGGVSPTSRQLDARLRDESTTDSVPSCCPPSMLANGDCHRLVGPRFRGLNLGCAVARAGISARALHQVRIQHPDARWCTTLYGRVCAQGQRADVPDLVVTDALL